jgi:hypothetical protein
LSEGADLAQPLRAVAAEQLRAEPLLEATAWMDTYRELWERRVDRLDEHLREIQKGRSTE